MFRFDTELRMAAENEKWRWSILFSIFSESPKPPCVRQPFEHMDEEFHLLLLWITEEGKSSRTCLEHPVLANVFKLCVKNERGGKMPLLCPVQGLISDILSTGIKQVVFAIEVLVRVGKIYFPTMNMSRDEFRNLIELVDLGVKYDDIMNMMDVFKA